MRGVGVIKKNKNPTLRMWGNTLVSCTCMCEGWGGNMMAPLTADPLWELQLLCFTIVLCASARKMGFLKYIVSFVQYCFYYFFVCVCVCWGSSIFPHILSVGVGGNMIAPLTGVSLWELEIL